MSKNFGLDELAKYATAVGRFEKLRAQLDEADKKLADSLAEKAPLMRVTELFAKYQELTAKVSDTDREIDRLYDACIHGLDDAFEATAELRLPQLCLSRANGFRDSVRSAYGVNL